jgi:hypothetical protein
VNISLPDWVRKLLLRRLFTGTAGAMGVATPDLRGLSSEELLTKFARFTANADADSAELFAVTYGFGTWLRRVFHIRSTSDVMAAARFVYRAIGIDFEGDASGEITIRRCFFSNVYTPSSCRTMSALDAGLLAGLSGGRRLLFSQRITAGFPCCRAYLESA